MSLRSASGKGTHTPKVCFNTLAIYSVMLFHSADELQVVAHGVITAMMLQKEAIRVRTSPSAAHVRAYMVAMDREPSGT